MSYLQPILLASWLLLFFFLTILTINRQLMVKAFVSKQIQQESQHQKALKRMSLLGMRFDLKSISIVLLPFTVFSSIISLFSPSLAHFFATAYIVIFSLALFVLVFGNYFYFKTYNNYYDIFMFGFVEDDTKAIIKNICDDYPVVKLVIAILGLSFIAYFIVDFSFNHLGSEHSWFIDFLLIASIVIFVLFARGTFNSLPLGKSHAQVSSLNVINKMVPNGVVAFEWALKDRKRDIHFAPVNQQEGEPLINELFNKNNLLDKTTKNEFLAKNKPNVVFALMESFGSNCLALDNPQTNDLLGKLRPYLDSAFYFKRFTSYCDGTAPSLAFLAFNSPIQNISQSIAQNTKLEFTPFFTYKKQGYKTVFITSGNIMWRNLGNYLPLQGVDEVYDQNSIIDIFPAAKETLSYWGIADEYAFLLAEKLLQESNDQPLFINILTITNHPPYEVPDLYQPNPVDANLLVEKFTTLDESQRALTTFQYAANALGEFIERMETTSVGQNTIIAASGDHHLRGMKPQLPQEVFLHKAVPFIVQVPPALRAQLELSFDQNRLGSHKDIMPTLFALSLSEAEYWNVGGRNLLSAQQNAAYDFAYNTSIWATENGVIDLSVEGGCKYAWQDDLLVSGEILPLSEQEMQRVKAYQKLIYWQINYLVKGYE